MLVGKNLFQPDGYICAGRPLAWGQLDVRHLGSATWGRARTSSCLEKFWDGDAQRNRMVSNVSFCERDMGIL
ncbi:hypothetical protein PMm318_A31400 [Pseudomonas moorei]